MNTAVKPSP
uniref:Uncharacterized protein n=1 Tax=Anguilla anguilla TaxID=7936 RepID=A0A0E9UDK3_ANGAN